MLAEAMNVDGWHLLAPLGIKEKETAKVVELKARVEAKFDDLSEEEGKVCTEISVLLYCAAVCSAVCSAVCCVQPYCVVCVCAVCYVQPYCVLCGSAV